MSGLVAGLVLLVVDDGPGVSVDQVIGAVFVVAAAALLLRRATAAPKIWVEPWGVRAATPRLATALALGGWSEEVLVETRTRRVHVQRRRWWRSTSTAFAFDEVDHVGYTYREVRQGLDDFEVSLVLEDGTVHPLFSFKAEEAPGSAPSREASLSRGFVRQLSAALGVECRALA